MAFVVMTDTHVVVIKLISQPHNKHLASFAEWHKVLKDDCEITKVEHAVISR